LSEAAVTVGDVPLLENHAPVKPSVVGLWPSKLPSKYSGPTGAALVRNRSSANSAAWATFASDARVVIASSETSAADMKE